MQRRAAARREVETLVEEAERQRILQMLEHPSLELEQPDAGFDPYDSGAFDSRRAWSKVRRR